MALQDDGPDLWAGALLRHAVTGVLLVAPDGVLLDANPALLSLLGLPPDALAALARRDPALAADLREQLAAHAGSCEPFTFVRRFPSTDGGGLPTRITAVPLPGPDGTTTAVALQVEDATDGKDGRVQDQDRGLDPLTGLADRQLFYDRLSAALAAPRRPARRLAVLVVNLNRFQQVNAGLGHLAADQVLVQVAQRLQASAGRRDTVARLGGDWFACVARGVVTHEDAVELAVRLRDALREPYWVAGNAVYVSARIGVATAPYDGTTPSAVVRRATTAAGAAKGHAHGWALPAPGGDGAGRDELSLVTDLKTALDNGELGVAYQPTVDDQAASTASRRWHGGGTPSAVPSPRTASSCWPSSTTSSRRSPPRCSPPPFSSAVAGRSRGTC